MPPTIAILGATGSTGSSILTLVAASPDTKINVLVRSRAKLDSLVPHASHNPNITVFEGSISNAQVLTQCLSNTTAVFLTVAVKDNIPGTTLSLDTAQAVVSSLSALRDAHAAYKPPHLIVLSSASLAQKFWTGIPPMLHTLLYCAMYFVYTDLAAAETFLREQPWLSCTFVMPGALSHDVQRGHVLSLTAQQSPISFLDVAAGMIQVAHEGERWAGERVSVLGKGGVKARFPWEAPWTLAKGLVLYACPWAVGWLV